MAQKYDGHDKRRPGRPRTAKDLASLVIRIARENRTWGYRRIQGALSTLGHKLARSTIADILRRHGVEPAPERSRKTTWKEFLAQHWELIVAADFFTAEVWTARGLKRFLVLFFIDLSTRKVEIGGIVSNANGLWMTQIGRRATDAGNGILMGKRYLIHDRDPLFTAEFQDILASVGCREAAAAVTESERSRREICALDQRVVPGPADLFRRGLLNRSAIVVKPAQPFRLRSFVRLQEALPYCSS
jgi:hypothetical protein